MDGGERGRKIEVSSHFDEDLSFLGLLELSLDDLEGLVDLGGLDGSVGFGKSGRHDRWMVLVVR